MTKVINKPVENGQLRNEIKTDSKLSINSSNN